MKSQPHFDSNRDVGSVLSQIVQDVQKLLRKELELIKEGLKEQAEIQMRALVAAALGGLLATVGVGALAVALAHWLQAGGMSPQGAYAITGALFIVVGGLAFLIPRNAAKKSMEKAHETAWQVKQSVEVDSENVRRMPNVTEYRSYPGGYRENES